MENQYLGALKHIERVMGDGSISYSRQALEQLNDLTVSMTSQNMTDNDYLKIMSLYGKKYKQMGNKKALHYCVIRMQQVLSYRKDKKRQKEYPKLTFTNEMDEDTVFFLKPYPQYLSTYNQRYKKRIVKYATIIYVAVLAFLVLGMRISFLATWIVCLILYFLIVLIAIRYGYAVILNDHFDDLMRAVENNFANFESSMRQK